MRNPLTPVLHPVEAWRAFAQRVDARADEQARCAGLAVETLHSGVHRYRDPRLDELADHRAETADSQDLRTAPAHDRIEVAGLGAAWSTPTLTCAGWSR